MTPIVKYKRVICFHMPNSLWSLWPSQVALCRFQSMNRNAVKYWTQPNTTWGLFAGSCFGCVAYKLVFNSINLMYCLTMTRTHIVVCVYSSLCCAQTHMHMVTRYTLLTMFSHHVTDLVAVLCCTIMPVSPCHSPATCSTLVSDTECKHNFCLCTRRFHLAAVKLRLHSWDLNLNWFLMLLLHKVKIHINTNIFNFKKM